MESICSEGPYPSSKIMRCDFLDQHFLIGEDDLGKVIYMLNGLLSGIDAKSGDIMVIENLFVQAKPRHLPLD